MDLSRLSREPSSAFIQVAQELTNMLETVPQNSRIRTDIKLKMNSHTRLLAEISNRLEDSDLIKEVLVEVRSHILNDNVSSAHSLSTSLEATAISQLAQKHFLDPKDSENFEEVHWDRDDREVLFETLAEARKFAQSSDSFDDRQTRKILFYLGKVESEVLKPVGSWSSILGASYQVLDLVEATGEKAKPLAKLVETMRTTTKRNVNEYKQIAAPEEPKKLPKPEED